MIREFIEDHLPHLGEWLYGKETEIVFLANEADYSMVMELRQRFAKDCDVPQRVQIGDNVSFDDGEPETIPPGKVLILTIYTSGVVMPARIEKGTITFKRKEAA